MKQLSSILGGIVVIAISVVFVVGVAPLGGGPVGEGVICAAEVKGDCVPSTDYDAAFRLIVPRGLSKEEIDRRGLRRIILDGLIERQLLLREAERFGITASEEDVTRELAKGRLHVSLPVGLAGELAYSLGLQGGELRLIDVTNPETGKFDAKLYEQQTRLLSKMSPSDFREFQQKELIASRMRDLIRARVRVGEAEARSQFERDKSTITVEYARLDRRFYGERVLDLSDEAIAAWAKKNKQEVDDVFASRKETFLPECRVTRHIAVLMDPASVEALEPEKQKAEAKARIDALRKRIEDGDDFAEVAQTESDAPNALRGGRVGCIAQNTPLAPIPKPIEDAIMALKDGEVSPVVETEEGFHIVKVEKVAKGAEAEQEGRHQTELELYVQMETERMAAEGAQEILAAVRGGKTLDEALSIHLKSHGIGADAGSEDAPGDEGSEGQDGDEGEGDGDGDDADAAGDETKRNNMFDMEPPIVETSLPFNRSGNPIPGARGDKPVADMLFKLEKPGDVPNDVIPLEQGYAVARLKEKQSATDEAWEQDGEFYRSGLRANKQKEALINAVRRLRAEVKADIKIDSRYSAKPDASAEAPEAP